MIRPPPSSTLFPYTPLFGSEQGARHEETSEVEIDEAAAVVINHGRGGRRHRQRERDWHREILGRHPSREEDRHEEETAAEAQIRIDERDDENEDDLER